MIRKCFFIFITMLLLTGCAASRTRLPLEIPKDHVQDLISVKPLIGGKLVSVVLDPSAIQQADWNPNFEIYKKRRLIREFPELLKKSIGLSGIFDVEAKKSFTLIAKPIKWAIESPERGYSLLKSNLSVQYQLIDTGTIVATWNVDSLGGSNGLLKHYLEVADDTILRNVRLLILTMIANSDSSEANHAINAIAAVKAEVDPDLRGNLFMRGAAGLGDGLSAVGGATMGALKFVGENSEAISDGLKSTSAEMDRSSRAYNSAYSQAIISSRQQQASPSAYSGQRGAGSQSNPSTAQSNASASTNTSAYYSPTKVAAKSGHVCPEDNRMFTSEDLKANCGEVSARNRAKSDAEAKQKADEEHKKEAALAAKIAAEEKEKADKEAKRKAEGWVVNERVYADSLEEHQAETWCQRKVAEFRKDMAASGNKLISIGGCSCKPGGNGVSFQKEYHCEFPVSYRAYSSNSR